LSGYHGVINLCRRDTPIVCCSTLNKQQDIGDRPKRPIYRINVTPLSTTRFVRREWEPKIKETRRHSGRGSEGGKEGTLNTKGEAYMYTNIQNKNSHVRIDKFLKQRLKVLTARKGTTMTHVVNKLVLDYLKSETTSCIQSNDKSDTDPLSNAHPPLINSERERNTAVQ
jgi:hypothetical protein